MSVTETLAGSPVVHTTSLEEARDAVTRVYLPHSLEGARDEIDMRLNAVTDSVLTLGYLTYGGETALHMPATETCYHVNLDVAGQTWADRSDGGLAHTLPHQGGTVLTPIEHTTVRWSDDAEQLILKISRSRLEGHLSDLLGRPVSEPVRFDLALDLAGPDGQALLRSVAFLAAELDRPGALDATLARTQLESYVLTRLLMAGRHQFSDALAGSEDETRLGRLAPVVRYVDEHADAELTPAVLARVACVSVRTLHAAFQERLGESPMGYVRRVRLEKVRAELLAGDPQTTRVTEVATRWGFYHQSRFAQQYRRHTGELPSHTLLR